MTADALAELERFVAELAVAGRFSGAVLVAHEGAQLLALARGYASKGFDVPNRIDTKFNLASMNKMFTGVAVLQLVEGGRLGLEDRVAERLPWYRGAGSDRMTVHHLLTHTSGLGSYWNDRFEASKANAPNSAGLRSTVRGGRPRVRAGRRLAVQQRRLHPPAPGGRTSSCTSRRVGRPEEATPP